MYQGTWESLNVCIYHQRGSLIECSPSRIRNKSHPPHVTSSVVDDTRAPHRSLILFMTNLNNSFPAHPGTTLSRAHPSKLQVFSDLNPGSNRGGLMLNCHLV